MNRSLRCVATGSYGLWFCAIALLVTACTEQAGAQQGAAAGDDLSIEQAQLADRFERLEIVATRLAELSTGSDPRRARLLRDAIALSREEDVGVRFEAIVGLLQRERLAAASRNQRELQAELKKLLDLLLKDTRSDEIESQQRRIRRYLKEVGRLIRWQRGIRARTEGGDQVERLERDQQSVADKTGKLRDDIAATEGNGSDGKSDEGTTTDDEANESNDDDNEQTGDGAEGESGDQPPPSDKPPSADNNDGGQPSQRQGQQPSAEGGQPGNGADPSQSQSDGQPGEQPSGQPSPGGSAPSDSQQQRQQQPVDRAADRLRNAQRRMQQALEQLEKAERDGATKEQQQALEELEQAKAELERILRQLREEEMEQMLTMLTARLRKMLKMQLEVYDGTVRLDKVTEDEREHQHEIEAARLSRQESVILRDADRALVLLREEGSSVAFPEALEHIRDDVREVRDRLAAAKVGLITQGLEEDIIAALEECIAAMERALEDLEENRTPPGQSPPSGAPSEPPLVDKLAELRMIRALQWRINRRTQRYGNMIDGEQAEVAELREAPDKLAERQYRVFEATRDLAQGRND